MRTPAMQAGLARRKLTFRDIFVPMLPRGCFVLVRSGSEEYHGPMEITKCAA